MSSDNLYTALLNAQRAMGPVKKDASNPAFRTKYATLQSVLETVEGPLHDNGLVLVQRLQYDRIGRDGREGEGTPILITELIHAASGAKLDSAVPVVCKDPLDPQKVGGALTYYRRYSLLALLGLAPDDDGNSAAQPRRSRDEDLPNYGARAVKDGAPVGPAPQRAPSAPRPQPAPAQPQQGGRVPYSAHAGTQPPYSPSQAQRAEQDARAAAPLTDAEFAQMMEAAWQKFEDGKDSYADLIRWLQEHRPRMTDEQFERSKGEVKQIKAKYEERAAALAPAAPEQAQAQRPASYAG